MKRYRLISLGLRALVALVVLSLYFFGAFEPLAGLLDRFWTSRGVYPGGGIEVERLKWAEWIAVPIITMWTCRNLADTPPRPRPPPPS